MTFSQNSVTLFTQEEFDKQYGTCKCMMTLFFSDTTMTKLWGAIASQTPGPIFTAVKIKDKPSYISICEDGVLRQYNGEMKFDTIVNCALSLNHF